MEAADQDAGRERRKLLIADDEPSLRMLVRTTLEDPRYDIIEAADGVEALELARRELPRVALLDVMMPGMTGIEVCRLLKSSPETRQIVVIILSARAQAADRESGLAAGADIYLTKPFRPLQLLTLVTSFLEQ